jgi:putative oxidoreductase
VKLARLATRTIVGGLFVGHGTQKLFGWFGGNGLEATAAGFDSLGLRPGKRNATAAGLSEAVGGALLAVGLFTPLAAAALVGTMITAIRTVHWKNGMWATNGGYEYNLVLIAAVLTLVETGPGCLSLDAARGSRQRGLCWAAGVLAAGAASSVAVVEAARRQPVPIPTETGAAS